MAGSSHGARGFGRALRLQLNRGVARAIGFNETGFGGLGDDAYRTQGWNYLLCGGSLYGNLDFSFGVGHEDGSDTPRFSTPLYDSGGSPALRRQLAILLRFAVTLALPAGEWRFEWVDILTGEVTAQSARHESWATRARGERRGGGAALRVFRVGAAGPARDPGTPSP